MAELSNEQKLELLVKKCMEVMPDFIAKNIPDNGKFSPVSLTFQYPGTNYKGFLIVEYDGLSEDGTGRRLRAAMVEEGHDRMVSHYITKGDNAQILSYLAEENNAKELIQSYNSHKKTVDNFDY